MKTKNIIMCLVFLNFISILLKFQEITSSNLVFLTQGIAAGLGIAYLIMLKCDK